MKLYLSQLERLLELPSKEISALRVYLDEAGLEVKNTVENGGNIVFTIETLANRWDHLSALGIARELGAKLLIQMKSPQVVGELPSRLPSTTVEIETDLCHAYSLTDLHVSPSLSLRPEIKAVIGDSEKHPIVDILNYVQSEIGTPMHAFDKDLVEGLISIKTVESPTEIEALDGKTYKLPIGAIVICDSKKIIAVGGIIGCANSMTSSTTERVLLEAASFDPVSVRKTARAMGISTDASHSFERGSDIDQIPYAVKRVLYLAQGASKESDSCQAFGFQFKKRLEQTPREIIVRLSEVRKHLHAPRLSELEIVTRLRHLGYQFEMPSSAASSKEVTSKGSELKISELTVIVPSWRLGDINNEMDVVEDIIFALGIERAKITSPTISFDVPSLNPLEGLREVIEPALHAHGFSEVITKGFYSDADVSALKLLWGHGSTESKAAQDYDAGHIRLKNSVESSFAAMKRTNAIHLSKLAERNLRQGVHSVKAYEFGRLFERDPHELPSKATFDQANTDIPEKSSDLRPSVGETLKQMPYEQEYLTIAQAGRWNIGEWSKPEDVSTKLRAFKGLLESLFSALGEPLTLGESEHPMFHPGAKATLKARGQIIGHFGLLHPQLNSSTELSVEMIYAELKAEALARCIERHTYQAASTHPSIRRDFTLKVGLKEAAGKVIKLINSADITDLTEVQIVDDFRRQEEDFRRVSYRLTFQRIDRTLEHQEVDQAVAKLQQIFKEKALLV